MSAQDNQKNLTHNQLITQQLDEQIRLAFEKYDEDESGELCMTELRYLLNDIRESIHLTKMDDLMFYRVSEILDENRNGLIELDELLENMPAVLPIISEIGVEMERMIKTAFKDFDIDGSGYLEKPEQKLLFNQTCDRMGLERPPDWQVAFIISLIDDDDNAQIDLMEFMDNFPIIMEELLKNPPQNKSEKISADFLKTGIQAKNLQKKVCITALGDATKKFQKHNKARIFEMKANHTNDCCEKLNVMNEFSKNQAKMLIPLAAIINKKGRQEHTLNRQESCKVGIKRQESRKDGEKIGIKRQMTCIDGEIIDFKRQEPCKDGQKIDIKRQESQSNEIQEQKMTQSSVDTIIIPKKGSQKVINEDNKKHGDKFKKLADGVMNQIKWNRIKKNPNTTENIGSDDCRNEYSSQGQESQNPAGNREPTFESGDAFSSLKKQDIFIGKILQRNKTRDMDNKLKGIKIKKGDVTDEKINQAMAHLPSRTQPIWTDLTNMMGQEPDEQNIDQNLNMDNSLQEIINTKNNNILVFLQSYLEKTTNRDKKKYFQEQGNDELELMLKTTNNLRNNLKNLLFKLERLLKDATIFITDKMKEEIDTIGAGTFWEKLLQEIKQDNYKAGGLYRSQGVFGSGGLKVTTTSNKFYIRKNETLSPTKRDQSSSKTRGCINNPTSHLNSSEALQTPNLKPKQGISENSENDIDITKKYNLSPLRKIRVQRAINDKNENFMKQSEAKADNTAKGPLQSEPVKENVDCQIEFEYSDSNPRVLSPVKKPKKYIEKFVDQSPHKNLVTELKQKPSYPYKNIQKKESDGSQEFLKQIKENFKSPRNTVNKELVLKSSKSQATRIRTLNEMSNIEKDGKELSPVKKIQTGRDQIQIDATDKNCKGVQCQKDESNTKVNAVRDSIENVVDSSNKDSMLNKKA